MQTAHLKDMVKGWFIGNFEPSLWKTTDVEVGVKTYARGDKESAHFHKIATEFTVILNGRVKMNGVEYGHGQIVVIEPGDVTDFEALEDTTSVVVKLPGANDDKYLA